jgi:RHS repeat-associated protein
VKENRLEISESVSAEAFQQAIFLTEAGAGAPVAVSATQPVREGRQALRRIVLEPSVSPAMGTLLELRIEPSALVDAFGNLPAETYVRTFVWSDEDMILDDTSAPEISAVRLLGRSLEIELREEPDLGTVATAVTIGGQQIARVLADDRYTVRSDGALAAGVLVLSIDSSLTDVAGINLPENLEVQIPETVDDAILFEMPDVRETFASTIGNPVGFQGLDHDSATGFVYVRNRWLDPEIGRFVTGDPLGFVDGPNPYQFSGNSPLNYSDPFGLQVVKKVFSPIYVKVEPIKSSISWSRREIRFQLETADEVFGDRAGVYVFWTGITEDLDPREVTTAAGAIALLNNAAAEYGSGTGTYQGLPIFYLREVIDTPNREGGSAVGPLDELGSGYGAAIVARYWSDSNEWTNRYTTAHELGHAIGGLCDPADMGKGCRFGAPQPRFGGVMYYPSKAYPRAQGGNLTEGEIKRLRLNARAFAASGSGGSP